MLKKHSLFVGGILYPPKKNDVSKTDSGRESANPLAGGKRRSNEPRNLKTGCVTDPKNSDSKGTEDQLETGSSWHLRTLKKDGRQRVFVENDRPLGGGVALNLDLAGWIHEVGLGSPKSSPKKQKCSKNRGHPEEKPRPLGAKNLVLQGKNKRAALAGHVIYYCVTLRTNNQ